ncbi:acyltransferase family protein [Lactobacillus delbrueckii]|uniref:acyltransferase family protein n=1 Tax=Lactobacillus delbrueckii TaxID=1584 RepID=UPI0027296897|nr:acyltransferase [Lactobacillus delbrueckii]WKZ98224.1 acyltransferase [Lactobacillus delbrueckii]
MAKFERYDNLDGLKAISCIGIIGMHIAANAQYNLNDWFGQELVPSFTWLVFLFIMISGFGMFNGYYERMKNGEVDLNYFYNKRYKKLFPFFAFLIVLDILYTRQVLHVVEGLTESTLAFGLLPNNQPSVVGVGWTLGVIFLFYMLFPFFVFLCWDKKRAWISFAISLILNIFCGYYYFTDKFVVKSFGFRHNFLFCAPYFLIGGIIYLYREEIKRLVGNHQIVFLMCTVIWTGAFYMLGLGKYYKVAIYLLLYTPWLCYAIGAKKDIILNNEFVSFMSSISFEMYLAQMFIFRLIQKIGILYFWGHGWLDFLIS